MSAFAEHAIFFGLVFCFFSPDIFYVVACISSCFLFIIEEFPLYERSMSNFSPWWGLHSHQRGVGTSLSAMKIAWLSSPLDCELLKGRTVP